ncbi:MAG: alpha-2-macroglobulin family protein [Rubellimicrobium sp.]|nr:alpha-2-macroglobulin family protein [Rubellimicrobium sp.]
MRRHVAAVALALAVLAPLPVLADNGVPQARVAISTDTDFPGFDLAQILDTTLDACQAACMANAQCAGFTFNARNNSCFAKGALGAPSPYADAISGRVLRTDPAVLAAAPARAGALDFLGSADLDAAENLARNIGRRHSSNGNTPDALRSAAAQAGDAARAMGLTGAAVSLTDSAADWIDYARFALQVADGGDTAARTARDNALSALVSAWLRVDSPVQQADVLALMADALERQRRGRAALAAIRLARELRPGRDLDAAFDRLSGLYGFNVADTQVDSDPAVPRVCVTFNDALVQAGVDYAPFVQMPGVSFTTEVSGRQLCLDGMRHGERLALTLRQGLPAASGEMLARNVDLNLYIRDRLPQAHFAGRAYVLPRTPDAGLPLETVNVDRLDLQLSRLSERNILRSLQDEYFANPVYAWQEEWFDSQIAEPVWSGSLSVSGDLNRDTLTRVPVAEPLLDQPPGLYVLTATIPGVDPWDTPPASQWFLLSDLGIATMSGSDGLSVDVRSLADTAPVAGAEVQLVTRANAVLGTAVTDAEGHAQFDAGLTRGTGAAEPALVTVASGDDMGFLSLLDPAFDLSDRGVEGREAAGPMDVFLTTERGIYRAGDVVHLTALMRDEAAVALPGVPLTAILVRPDGVEYARVASTTDLAGGHVFALPVAPAAPRGTWTVEVRADVDAPALATTRFLVEDFLPERIDVTLGLPDSAAAGRALPVDVTARYLFGPPAPDLAVEGEVVLKAAGSLPGWPGYVFGRQDETFYPATAMIDAARTGADGAVVVNAALPDAAAGADRPLEATVTLRVSEGSGRPVERSETLPVTPGQSLIGLHPRFDGVLPEDSTARFDVIALAPDLGPVAMEVQWSVNRLNTRYQWFSTYGEWNWDRVVTRERVASGTASLGDQPVTVSAPVTWGEYELVVESTGADYRAASMTFDAGWYGAGSADDTPDTLEASLDAATYAPGDTAMLRIVPRFAGAALVSVVSDHVIAREWVEVAEGENRIPLAVTPDWGTGAYVSAMVLRPMDAQAGRNPSRALGLVHAGVDPGARALQVVLDAPLESRPRGPLTAGIEVRGAQPGAQAWVTLAAVDVGILNMTRFTSPDPQGYYFGQRRLGVELRDLYGRLIDGMSGTVGDLRSGGDYGGGMTAQAPPPTEEPVALFQGPVAVDDHGRAEITFDLPAFNGTVRLMAVAWSAQGVGQASADVLVRDPVAVVASLPRFLAPGDRSRLLLEFTHAEGPAGEMALQVTGDGVRIDPADVPATVTLSQGGQARLSIPVVAGAEGIHEVAVTLTTPDGRMLSRVLTLPVQVNDPEISRTTRLTLAPGQAFTLDRAAFDGLLPGTGEATLSIGPLARLDAAALMSQLDRYPYACTEQTASRALPLIYFRDVAQALGMGNAADLDRRIADAVTAVLANQDANGAFGMWSADSGDLWLDAYASDFLSRARAHGASVPETAWKAALDNLQNRVNYYPEFESGGEDLAYALLVLAREGRAQVGDLRYYADTRASAFGSPLAVAQLGAALASYGDQPRADAMFGLAARMIGADKGAADRATRADFGSFRRDAAAVLTLALESGSNAVDSAALAARIATPGATLSTQEAVWSLMATSALVDDLRVSGLTVDGAAPAAPVMRVSAARAATAPVRVANDGTAEVELTLTAFGVPDVPPAAGGQGYAISRSYYTMEGDPVTLDQVRAGTRLVTVLAVDPFGAGAAHLMVADPLPAGFEIDNPDLLRGGDISALPWLVTADPEHAEFRQDRFLAAVDARNGASFRLAYVVRAVSPGTFRHPAASVEDMYRPQMRANGDSGTVVVTE